jgi:hypothetical protein
VRIPAEQWAVYREVIRSARARGIPFAVGGAFGCAGYTGEWRNTKDLDFYILPGDREAMIAVLDAAGLGDLYDEQHYERHWIYRAHQGETIVDAIWAMANRRAEVDARWIEGGRDFDLQGEAVRLIAPEEMLWQKIYIVQRERCDWMDALNLVYAAGPEFDWDRLLERLGDDRPLLAALLAFFGWICPGRAARFPASLWERLSVPVPPPGPEIDRSRVALVDSRPWFQTSRVLQ